MNANPISRSLSTTLTLLSQPPDCGKEFNHPGNAEKSMNGSASAREKPNITAVGAAKELLRHRPMRCRPMTGAEKDTMANVAAMKKMPMSPPRSAAWSVLLAQLVGN